MRRFASRRSVAIAMTAVLVPLAAGAIPSWGPEWNLSQTPSDSETGLNHRPLPLRTRRNAARRVGRGRRREPDVSDLHASDVGGGVDSPQLIVPYPGDRSRGPGDHIGAKYPALVAEPGGDVHLFWHDYRIGGIDNVEIFTKTRPAGGQWDSSRPRTSV